MKINSKRLYGVLLLGTLQLYACAKPNGVPKESPSMEKSSGFYQSNLFSESELKLQATNLWKAGKTISAAEAEKCYFQEMHRPQVQTFCLLLWSVRAERNLNLMNILLEKSSESSSLAIATFLQKEAVAILSSEKLLKTIDLLQDQPLSLLTGPLEERYLKDSSKIAIESNDVMPKLRAIFLKNPKDLVPYLRITWLLDRVEFQRNLQRVCHQKASGIANWYCWKMLQFRNTDSNMLKELRSVFRSHFPSQWNDPNWRNFQSTFPKTAKNSQKALEAK